MRAKQPRLSIIGSCYRLPANCRTAEKFINLAHGRRFGRFWRHIPSGYASIWGDELAFFYDPVVLGKPNIAEAHVKDWNRRYPHMAITPVSGQRELDGEDSMEDADGNREQTGDSLLQDLNRL